MTDLFREIGQSLGNNKLRTALTGIAVSWGIFMLIVLLGMSNGVVNAFSESTMSSGTDRISVFGGYTAKPFGGYKEGRHIRLRDTDGEKVLADNRAHTAEYSYTIMNNEALVSTRDDYLTGYTGCFPSKVEEKGLMMVAGRFVNDADMSGRRKIVVMSLRKAEVLFGKRKSPEMYVGERVNIAGLSFRVAGVYDHKYDDTVFIPYSTAKLLNGNEPRVNELSVRITDVRTEADGEETESAIRASLAKSHQFDPDDTSAVWVWNRFVQHLQASQGLSLLDVAVWVIGLLTLLSGVVGVSNIMFVSVKERTHEIGIRRAIGAKPRDILTQVITESVCITALFGYVGVVAGVGLTMLLGNVFADSEAVRNPGVDISVAMEVTVTLIVAGALAGLFPALKAIKVKPVEALRDE